MDNTDQREGRAVERMSAVGVLTAPPDFIDAIRLNYRLSKSAEQARISIDQKLVAYARVYLTHWHPASSAADREKAATLARRVIRIIRKNTEPPDDSATVVLVDIMRPMVLGMQPAWDLFEEKRVEHKKHVQQMVKDLPAWQRLQDVRGFGVWGLGTIIGEAGDIGAYSGCRKLYKRLGLAPDDCYPRGEKRTGRMIPRNTRGRLVGIVFDPLIKAQWRAAVPFLVDGKDDEIPAHAIGPYGAVYGVTKERHLAAGRTKGHAFALARRAMLKALLHDVWRAWHGLPLDYISGVPAWCTCLDDPDSMPEYDYGRAVIVGDRGPELLVPERCA